MKSAATQQNYGGHIKKFSKYMGGVELLEQYDVDRYFTEEEKRDKKEGVSSSLKKMRIHAVKFYVCDCLNLQHISFKKYNKKGKT